MREVIFFHGADKRLRFLLSRGESKDNGGIGLKRLLIPLVKCVPGEYQKKKNEKRRLTFIHFTG
jgi:hypothetical protein